MRIIIRIGGSVVASPVNSALFSKYALLVEQLKKQGHDVAVVVGGGTYARELIRAAKDLGLDEKAQDEIAISVSRIFAQLFLKKLGTVGCVKVPLTVKEALGCLQQDKVAVVGGLKPGMTTDTVAALLAEETKADLLIKATDQEGVYDKDPRKHADAVKLDHLAFKDLPSVLSQDEHKAGIHQIIDPEAAKILKRSKVKMVAVNGFKPENLLAAVRGERVGTLID
jgi:uridylate kinase